jgi:hypothetical protein
MNASRPASAAPRGHDCLRRKRSPSRATLDGLLIAGKTEHPPRGPRVQVGSNTVVASIRDTHRDVRSSEHAAAVAASARAQDPDRHAFAVLQQTVGNRALSRWLLNAGERALQRDTSFDKPEPATHSATEAGVFGIGPAGWKFLEDEHQTKTRYGWDKSPLQPDTGVYSVVGFLEDGWRSVSSARQADRLESWLNVVLMVEPEVHGIAQADAANMGLVHLFKKYDLGSTARDMVAFLEYVRKTDDTPALANAVAKAGSIGTSGSVEQARFESKRGLVDLLQENIERYYSGKKLIPVYLALRKTGDGDFVPDLQVTVEKTKAYTTDREIRMIYKLTEEHPDPEVRAIAKKTFFFQEQTVTGPQRMFTTIPRPWDALDTDYSQRSTQSHDNFDPAQQRSWATRTRKHGQAYSARGPDAIPGWITKLTAIKDEAKRKSTVS